MNSPLQCKTNVGQINDLYLILKGQNKLKRGLKEAKRCVYTDLLAFKLKQLYEDVVDGFKTSRSKLRLFDETWQEENPQKELDPPIVI